MRRIQVSRWIAVGAVCAILAALGVVGARPLALDPQVVASQISALLGGRAELERASWHWMPEPRLVLLEPRVEWALGSLGKLSVAALRGEAAGLGLFAADGSASALPDRVDLRGLRIQLGQLSLLRGQFSVDRSGPNLQLRGHAFGAAGGRVDLRARLEGPSWQSASGQLYLEDLETSLGSFGSLVEPAGGRALRLNGVISATEVDNSGERFDVQLEILGVRANGPGSWLSATLGGVLEHSSAGWSPKGELELVGKIAIVAGERRIHALRSRARGTLRLIGDSSSGRAELALQLLDPQGHIDGWLEARELGSGRLRATVGLRDGRFDGTLDLGRLQLDLRRDSQGIWVARSDWLPFSELRPLLPPLSALPPGATGQARFTGRFDLAGGWTADIEAREVALPVRDGDGALISSIRMESARLRIHEGTLELDLPDLRIGAERLQLHVKGKLAGGSPDFALSGTADSLDLRGVARVLAALFGTPDTDLTLEAVLEPLVRALRRHPSFLAALVVRPSYLRVKELHGLGLDAQNAAIRVALRDQTLEIGCREAGDGKLDLRVRLDLKGWVPRVLREGSASDSSTEVAPGV